MTSEQASVDYGWVMQMTFITTIVVGAPAVAVASLAVSLPTWSDRAEFAIRVGAFVWLVTALAVFAYARTCRITDNEDSEKTE